MGLREYVDLTICYKYKFLFHGLLKMLLVMGGGR